MIVALETARPSEEQAPTTLIEVWDVEKSLLVETYLTRATSPNSNTTEAHIEPEEKSGLDAEVNPAAAIAELVRSRQQGGLQATAINRAQVSSSSIPRDDVLPIPSPTIRAIFVGSEFGGHQSGHRAESTDTTSDLNPQGRSHGRGFMISGSEDRRVRLWDLNRLERTAILSGPESELDKPTYR